MLSIRMKRVGKKHQPTYRIVVDEKRSKLVGKFIEDLGWYNPHQKTFGLKDERIKYWLGVGAQPSDTVHNLLVSKKVIEGEKVAVHKKPKKKDDDKKAEAPAEGEAPAEEVKTDTPKDEASVVDSKPAEEAPKPEASVEEKKEEELAPVEEASKAEETEK